MTIPDSAVYELLQQVPPGKVTTYGDIAKALGIASPRLVGRILNRNIRLGEIPCHRVVHSDGKLGGYASGAAMKQQMLEQEGIQFADGFVHEFESRRVYPLPLKVLLADLVTRIHQGTAVQENDYCLYTVTIDSRDLARHELASSTPGPTT